MDVAILCGGYGTRLAGLWDGPKCLVPLGDGKPILWHLLMRCHSVRPNAVFLLTGYKGVEVTVALRELSLLSPNLNIIHSVAQGTAAAVRGIIPHVRTPLLVLNGDTLPRYDLNDLTRAWIAAQPDVLIAYCAGKPAGAMILGQDALERLPQSSESDLERWLTQEVIGNTLHIGVTGFLDVGTPHGFHLAKEWI